MKALSVAARAAIAQGVVPIAQLVELDLSTTVRLNTTSWDLAWNGQTWQGANGVGLIDVIDDSPGQVKGLRFNLTGVPSSMLAIALAEPLQGKAVTIYTAIFDVLTYQIINTYVEWAGYLDTMQIVEQGDKADITVNAEHAGIDLIRPRLTRYTAQDQARIAPGDRGFQFVIAQSETPITWPARSYFFKT